jgi:3-hydroxymyristoyl/3-hydroxydecanoyl-(acyl carrier protein) dehydratase
LTALFNPSMPEPQWLAREPSEARAALDIDAGLQVLDGHFPQAPLVPGVAQIDWAIELARRCFEMPPHFVRADTLKFQRPMTPGLRVDLVLRWDAPNTALSFRYESPAGVHASGRLVFKDVAP